MKHRVYVLLLPLLVMTMLLVQYRYDVYYFLKGEYYLRPNAEIHLTVKPKSEQLEYSSELHLKIEQGEKIELSGREDWILSPDSKDYIVNGSELYFYDVASRTVHKREAKNGEILREVVPTDVLDYIAFSDNGIVFKSTEKKIFSVTDSETYTITVKNSSKKPVAFAAEIVNR